VILSFSAPGVKQAGLMALKDFDPHLLIFALSVNRRESLVLRPRTLVAPLP